MRHGTILPTALIIAATGCVSSGKYDAALADASKARTAEQKVVTDSNRVLEASRAEKLACQKALDDSTAMNQELHEAIFRSGKDADQMLAAEGELATSLTQAKARLEELRRAQAAAEARSALFRELALKLKRMIDAGDLTITLRSGRMVLALPNDVLFDSGKALLKPRGKETIGQLAVALATVQGRRFQVAGHTDNDPIHYSGFASNWQLSASRALEVVGFLIQGGMPSNTLSAAGYGEFDPVAGNDTPDGKTRNRRIEITLQPNIDELVAVP